MSRRADLLKNGNGVFNGALQTLTRLEMKQMAACRRGEGGAARRGGAAQGDAFVL